MDKMYYYYYYYYYYDVEPDSTAFCAVTYCILIVSVIDFHSYLLNPSERICVSK